MQSRSFIHLSFGFLVFCSNASSQKQLPDFQVIEGIECGTLSQNHPSAVLKKTYGTRTVIDLYSFTGRLYQLVATPDETTASASSQFCKECGTTTSEMTTEKTKMSFH